MSGIGSALKTGDDVVAWCKVIDDLSFALITPLHTQYYIYHKMVID
jgi:hypothetical protein